MIFVTIGTQEPFDRLIEVVDQIAGKSNEKFIAQTFGGKHEVKNMEVREFLNPKEFSEIFDRARLIISHAGMGTIISSLSNKKPIVVMPRNASLKEHRNDHQMATAKEFKELQYLHVAMDEKELRSIIWDLLSQKEIQPLHNLGEYASKELLGSLKEFINN